MFRVLNELSLHLAFILVCVFGGLVWTALMVSFYGVRFLLLRGVVASWAGWARAHGLTEDKRRCGWWHQQLDVSNDEVFVTFRMKTQLTAFWSTEVRELRVRPKERLYGLTVSRRSGLKRLVSEGKDDFIVGDDGFDREMEIRTSGPEDLGLFASTVRTAMRDVFARTRGDVSIERGAVIAKIRTRRRILGVLAKSQLAGLLRVATLLDRQNKASRADTLLTIAREDPLDEVRARASLALVSKSPKQFTAKDTAAMFERTLSPDLSEEVARDTWVAAASRPPAGADAGFEQLGARGGSRHLRLLEEAMQKSTPASQMRLQAALDAINWRMEHVGPGSLSLSDPSGEGQLAIADEPEWQSTLSES